MLTPRSFRRIIEGQQNASPGKTKGEYGSLRGRVTDLGVSLTPPRLVSTPKKSIPGGGHGPGSRGSEERMRWGPRGLLSSSSMSTGGQKPRGIWESSGSEGEEEEEEQQQQQAGSGRRRRRDRGGERGSRDKSGGGSSLVRSGDGGGGGGGGGGESNSRLKEALCGAWEENRILRNQLRELSLHGTPAPPSSSSSLSSFARPRDSRRGPEDGSGEKSPSPSAGALVGGPDSDLVQQIKELREGREHLRGVCRKQARELDRRSHRIAELSNVVSKMQRFIRERMRTAVDRGDGGGVDETDALGLESRGQDDEDDAGRSSVDGNDEHPYGLYATREFEKDDIELMLEALLRGDSGDFKALQADSKASAANSSNTAGDVNARGHAPASGGSIQEGDTKQMHSNIEKANLGLPLPDFDTWLAERHASESPSGSSGVLLRGEEERRRGGEGRRSDATQIELDMETAHAVG